MGDILATAIIKKVIVATATIKKTITATATIVVTISGIDTDAQTFIDAAGITDSTQKTAIDVLVTELKAKNVWEKLAVVYPIVGGDATKHSFNLVNPNTFQNTSVNTPTHSANGVDYNGTNEFIRTGFAIPISPFHIGVYIRENVADSDDDDMGSREGGAANNSFINSRTDADRISGAINATGITDGTVTDSRGFTLVNKTNTNVNDFYKNGVFLSGTSIANGNSTLEMYLGGRNLNSTLFRPSTRQAAFYTMGYDLTATEILDYYNAIQTFQTSLSRQV